MKLNNLKPLNQYAIDRDLFIEIFREIEDYIWDDPDYEGDDFKFWGYDDEWYLLHKDSGTLVNWYKNLGRTNTCNKKLTIEEYKMFVKMFIEELKRN